MCRTCLLLAVNGAVWIALWGTRAHDWEQPAKDARNEAAVSLVHLANGGEAARMGDSWRLLSPFCWPIDPLRMEAAIGRMEAAGGDVSIFSESLCWEDVLDRHLLRIEDRPVRLRLAFGEKIFLLERRGEEWALLPRWPIDRKALEDLLQNLSLLSFRSIALDRGDGCRGEPQLAISVESPFPDRRKRLEFFLSGRTAVIPLPGGLCAEISSAAVHSLLEPCTRLRSRKIFQNLAGQHLLWRDGESLLVLERQDGDITLLDPSGVIPVFCGSKAVRVAERMMSLCWTDLVLEGIQPPDLGLYGLDRPVKELEVDGRRLLLGHSNGERTYGYVDNFGAIIAVATADVEEIAAEMARLAAH
ncbi:MAG: hypothetical protein LBF24_00805 [Puniceicoccales bacterium]|jgi:hypothetical protein|nr:hypothetical protein [Puniceicoccales bacterium]